MRKIHLLSVTLLITSILFAQVPSELMSLAKIQTGIKSKRISSSDKSGGNNDRVEHIAPGETLTLCDIKGAGIINHIWITIAPPPEHLNRNDIIIKMYWDGNESPSVHSPIGPFFGQGWNESYDYSSLPLTASPVDGRALVSYFAMPFEKGARIEIENQNDIEIAAFYYYVDYVETDKLPADLGRFHAWYNHERTESAVDGENEWDTLTGVVGKVSDNIDGKENYLIADIKGKGQFVGINYYVHSPTPIWYGEGDDMIFIDGDDSSALKGTGTEDYFNTAWCPEKVFSHPYYGCARVNNDIGWLGRTHVYRFHIADPIYFDNSLKFTIEHGHSNVLSLDLASVAYWYQQTASAVGEIPNKIDRKPMPMINYSDIHRWRHTWRESLDSNPKLWGNEGLSTKKVIKE